MAISGVHRAKVDNVRFAEVHSFEELARLPDEAIDTAVGAALIARDVYPNVDVHELLGAFDGLAAPLLGRDLETLGAEEQARTLAAHLYGTCGFRGNEEDYHDPRNSLLSDVLDRRLGIPISLAVVYCEVARRLGIPARGIGFPGHFLVRIERGEGAPPVVVDPFFGGRMLDRAGMSKLLFRALGTRADVRDEHLAVASPRAVLVRMLTNLKVVYVSRGDFARAHLALDRILTLAPRSVEALRERGLLAARLGALESARVDLTHLLELAPEAEGVEELRERLAELTSDPRSLN